MLHDERPDVVTQPVCVKVALRVNSPQCDALLCTPNIQRRTRKVVFVFTIFTIVSASDLSNCKSLVSTAKRVRGHS